MGRHIARNILEGGHEVTGFDLKREAAEGLLSLGARWAASLGAGSCSHRSPGRGT